MEELARFGLRGPASGAVELRKEVEDIDFNLHPQDVVNIKADLLRRVDTILVYLEG